MTGKKEKVGIPRAAALVWDICDSRTRRTLVGLLAMMILVSILETFGIALIFPVIKVVENPELIKTNEWLRRLAELTGTDDSGYFIPMMLAFMVLFFALKNITMGTLNFLQVRLVFTRRSETAANLFRLYLNIPYANYLMRHTAEMEANIRDNVMQLYLFLQALLKFTVDALIVIATLVLLCLVNFKVTLIAVALFGVTGGVLSKFFGNYTHILGRRVKESQKGTFESVIEGFGSIKELKVMDRGSHFSRIYHEAMIRNAHANSSMQGISIVPGLILEVLAVAGCCAIILTMQTQGPNAESTFGMLGLFAVAVVKLKPKATDMIVGIGSLKFHTTAVETIHREIKNYRTHWDALSEQKVESGRMTFTRDLHFDQLSFRYPDAEQPSLNQVSLSVRKGESIAFVGSSGAGKTTLANIMLGLLEPESGTVRADGRDVFEDIRAWQANLGFVPQSIYLLDGTVSDNVAFAMQKDEISEERVRQALETAQLTSFIEELPEGLNTRIGENGVRFSGGQRQRMGIARAVYSNPELLILDEATSALDSQTESEVTAAIESLAGKMTLIIIAHRMSTVRRCDRIYFLGEGRIIASGSFDELCENNEEFRRMATMDQA